MTSRTIPWVRCEACDDFLCMVHGGHVWECECPSIEWWAERNADPYSEVSDELIIELLEVAPVNEDSIANGVYSCDCSVS